MEQMHEPDNEANDESPRNPEPLDYAPVGDFNGHSSPQFTITCEKCGGWTAVNQSQNEIRCARCGAEIRLQSDIVVNFQPGMTPPVRWMGRIVLAILVLLTIVGLGALLISW